MSTKTETRFSITEYANSHQRLAFVCSCKKCNGALTEYFATDLWLDIAFVLQDRDDLTVAEFKKLNHLAVSQRHTIGNILSSSTAPASNN